MPKKATLITGAAGEIGQALLYALTGNHSSPDRIVTFDLQDLPPKLSNTVTHVKGSITDKALLEKTFSEHEFTRIYHLAAYLSTKAERTPGIAFHVNVDASAWLLELAAGQSEKSGKPVQFIFPSSMAIYGIPDLDTKAAYPNVREDQFTPPITMYGNNKLAVEGLGGYYSRHYKQLADEKPTMLDFRALRFPGLISAFTVPTGGTSDYGPEMLHAAAKGEAYACFVRPNTTIAFMAMPDAVKALLSISDAPREKLTHTAYNVTSFSLSAEDFRQQVLKSFPNAKISFEPDSKRQGIVDSWPMNMDDSVARADWGWAPEYGMQRCFEEYLVPNIRKRYGK
jgi:nucleoside-diphosphate-sugar epimerase